MPRACFRKLFKQKKQISPVYKVIKRKDRLIKKFFTVGVFVNDVLLGKGEGKSKQEAEKDAAQRALANSKS